VDGQAGDVLGRVAHGGVRPVEHAACSACLVDQQVLALQIVVDHY
jgi:hypothetical protein